MPRFVDAHPPDELPMTVVADNLRAWDRREPSAPGRARLVDYLVGERGWLVCVWEAPDAAAVRQWHVERGLPCREVRPLEASGGPPG